MSNDYTDLTEIFAELLDKYTVDDILVDLDAWDTDDLVTLSEVCVQVLDLRLDDMDLERQRQLAFEDEEEVPFDEYEEDSAQRDLEAEYDDPLFVG